MPASVRALIAALVTAASCIVSAAPDRQQTATVKVTSVWTGDDVPLPSGTITRDGRYLIFAGDALYIRDLITKKTEVRGKTDAGFATEPRPSPDNQWIAVAYRDYKAITNELRVAPFAGGESRTLHRSPAAESVRPIGWIQDGGEMLAWIGQPNGRANLSAFPIAGGAPRVIRELPALSMDRSVLSPDGRLVAYSTGREIRVIGTHGSDDALLLAEPSGIQVLSWTPNGRQLLFLSNRQGSCDAWSVEVANRRLASTPRLIAARLERTEAIGFGPDDQLYVHVIVGGVDTHLVPIDPATGLRRGQVTNLPGREPGARRHQGAWAPDNRRIAYVKSTPLRAASIGIHDTSTGRAREYPVTARVIERIVWHPSGQKIAMIVQDDQGQGVVELALDTGGVTRILGSTNAIHYSADGVSVIYRRRATADASNAVVKRNMATGAETVLYTGMGAFFVAPDEKSFLLYRNGTRSLWFAPAGKPDRQLVPDTPDHSREVALSRDGKYAYYARTSPWDIWMVPTAGGSPVALGVKIEGVDRITAKPDGTGLLLSAGTAAFEVQAWRGVR